MMSKMSRDELLQLIPAYVLGALDEDERRQVDMLLADDVEAQTMEKEYRQIEMMLPFMAVNRQASPDLKDRLLYRIHNNSADADETDNIDDDIDDADDVTPENVVPFKEKRKRSPRRQYIFPLAAVLVIAVIGLLFALSSSNETATPQAIFRSLYEQPNSERVYVEASADSAAHGTLLISTDGEQAVLRVRELPDLSSDKTFQLWLIDDAGSKSGGIYEADEQSELYVLIPNERPINTYTTFGMSIEPAGGSPLGDAPSGQRVFAVNVPTDETQEQ